MKTVMYVKVTIITCHILCSKHQVAQLTACGILVLEETSNTYKEKPSKRVKSSKSKFTMKAKLVLHKFVRNKKKKKKILCNTNKCEDQREILYKIINLHI